jgi:ATP-dependent exoDNAse (exonuclease V) beta subunit
MNARVDHEAILASAGSGKTYQLSNRIALLLAADAEPSSILALTFTRKAAGEFSRRSLAKLAAAADSDVNARTFAKELGLDNADEWDAGRFRGLLARALRNLHRFRLGTFDGFFQSLARAASFELGLSGAFTLLDERGAALANARVLRRVFQRGEGNGGGGAHGDFLAAFRLATWGREERGVAALLEKFTAEAADLLRDFPDAGEWGDPDAVFGETGCLWLPAPSGDEVAGALEKIAACAKEPGERGIAEALGKLADALREWEPGQTWEGGAFFEEKVLPSAEAALSGGDTSFLHYKKRFSPPPPLEEAFVVAARHVIGGSLERHLRITRGVHALTRRYGDFYEMLVRRAGQLTFADTEELLDRRRLDIAFRLDATTRHWLFDEFQDTSRRQWGIVADNLDEVLSDEEGGRSAFFVGDVKQALYGWRGGAHSLLGEIRGRYGERLKTRPLDASWRSCEPVLKLVNTVFGNLPAAEGALPPGAAAAWNGAWREHTPAGGARTRRGFAAWHVCAKEGRSALSEENMERRMEIVANLLRETRPLERGFTCGLLTQTNAEARLAADFLRSRGGRVASETDAPACEDNPVSLAFLSLLGFAAHPADGFHAGVVASTPPLAAWVASAGGETAARARLLESVAENGFARTLQSVADALGDALPRDPFSAARFLRLIEAAREFDSHGGRDTDEFVLFAKNSRHRDTGEEGSTRVMTIHKAKGLEFDIVFLPFLEGMRIDSPRKSTLLATEPGEEARWVLSNPGNLVCEHTPVLAEHLARRRETTAYEALCKLYVALTRAKRATHIITTGFRSEAASAAVNFPRLLGLALDCEKMPEKDDPPRIVWAAGDARWFEENPLPIGGNGETEAAPESAAPAAPPVETLTPRRIFPRVLPSQTDTGKVRAESLFAEATRGAAAGRCVHALLARVDFLSGDEEEIPRLARGAAEALRGEYDEESLSASAAMVEAALRSPALRGVFTAPAPDALLWRERAFDVILDGLWVSGVFDRVVLSGGEAWLHDFKTDANGAPSALLSRHSEQMALYRRALEKMTGFAPGKIPTRLVHVPDCVVVDAGGG